MTDQPTAGPPVKAAGATVGVSVADWTAGYEAGYAAGYLAARTALDDAARALAALRPSRIVDVADARTGALVVDEPDRNDPTAVAAYRARIYATWGLRPPTEPSDAEANVDGRRTA